MGKKSLFSVGNHHPNQTAPQIDGDEKGKYFGYFANEHGEQAMFIYHHKTQAATLRLGDAEWEKEYSVIDGHAPDLSLTDVEKLWLQACWQAATMFSKES